MGAYSRPCRLIRSESYLGGMTGRIRPMRKNLCSTSTFPVSRTLQRGAPETIWSGQLISGFREEAQAFPPRLRVGLADRSLSLCPRCPLTIRRRAFQELPSIRRRGYRIFPLILDELQVVFSLRAILNWRIYIRTSCGFAKAKTVTINSRRHCRKM